MTTALPYASDFSGVVCGFRFAPDSAGVPIDSSGALEWLAQSSPEHAVDDFVWLHFDLANGASERWMRTQLEPAPRGSNIRRARCSPSSTM